MWSGDRGPPPMGRFDEAKLGDSADSSRREAKFQSQFTEGKTDRRVFEGKRSESKMAASESKVREPNYKDNSIFVDDLESGTDDSSSDEEEEEEQQPLRRALDRSRRKPVDGEESEEDSIFDTDLEDSEDEEDSASETEEDQASEQHSSDSSTLSSDAFVEEIDLQHLRKFVGEDVVVCFGEAWLKGTVSEFQPNDGSKPTKHCGLLIEYEKAASEWLRDIDNDPDVQVLERGVSCAQRFNSVEIGQPVIGLYNTNCWCPGVVVQKFPARGRGGKQPSFGVRFETGQTAQCAWDEIIPVKQEVYKSAHGAKSSSKESPQSRGHESSSDESSCTSSSDSDSSEEFVGHRRRISTPPSRSRRSSKQSIEFSWQQHGKSAYRAVDGPPKDSESSVRQRPAVEGSSTRRRIARHDHGGSGRNLLHDGTTTGARERLLRDPQKLLALPLEELVEGGFARQVLSDHTRSPRMELERIDKWSHCKFRYEDTAKKTFYLYDELTGELLLTAKRVGSDFYISQYPEFPDLINEKNAKQHVHRACALLHFCEPRPNNPATASKRHRLRSRVGGRIARCQLWSTSCDYCDNTLAKYVCGPATHTGGGFYDALAPHKSRKSGRKATVGEVELAMLKDMGCRQLLADFTQSNVEIKMGKASSSSAEIVEARRLTVAVPTLAIDERSEQIHHCGWCDRCPRDQDTALQMTSTVPEWNEENERLTMCFEEGHVREHSAKNFLVHEVPDPLSSDKSPKSLKNLDLSPRSPRKGKSVSPRRYRDDRRSCLQFGKSSKRLFTLSYRYPMSAMQGFGIALSHFNWMPDQ